MIANLTCLTALALLLLSWIAVFVWVEGPEKEKDHDKQPTT